MAHEIYTKDQISQYYKRIRLPAAQHIFDIRPLDSNEALAHLTALQKHQICAIPFDNLFMHYSPAHHNNLTPQGAFRKLVETDGRGGYCMENTRLLCSILLSLGYDVYPTGARVKDGHYHGWGHMVNLVTIDGTKYSVDVGFGSNVPTHPLPLRHEEASVNIAPAQVRLTHKHISTTAHAPKMWVLERRFDAESAWRDMYCFSETEFFPDDYTVMNYWIANSRSVFFTYRVVCVKQIMGEDGDVIGELILTDVVKRRINGNTEVLEQLNNEDERVAALEKYFDIKLSDDERAAIHGTAAELVAKPY